MKIERNNYQIGIYLEKALSEKNMSVKQLSDCTGINIRLLSKYLINEQCPSLTNIQKIANALDKDVEYFTSEHYNTDTDISEKLGQVDSKMGYIKALIREDLKKEKRKARSQK